MRGRGSERHAGVFERCCRIHALVLGVKIFDSRRLRAPGQAIKRSIAFAQRDGMLFEIGNVRKKFAEAPDSALVEGRARRAAVEPERFQRRGVRKLTSPRSIREKEFQ